MRTRREVKIIEHTNEAIKELKKVYHEGICIDEYEKLVDEYKKLYKRYEKTIKVSDNIGNSIKNKNDSLHDNLDYIIKTARNKLYENISEHKKTKSSLLTYKEKIDNYKNIQEILICEKANIEKKLNKYKQQFGEIHFDNSMETIIKQRKIDHIDKNEFKNISLVKVLSLVFIDEKKEYYLIKLELKDFENIAESIKMNSSIKSFIEKIRKFIENNFNKNSIVYYDEKGIFYLGLIDRDKKEIISLITRLNSKRDIYGFEISFNFKISKFRINEESVLELINRLDKD